MYRYRIALVCVLFLYWYFQPLKQLQLRREAVNNDVKAQTKSHHVFVNPGEVLLQEEDETEPRETLEPETASNWHHNSVTREQTTMTTLLANEEASTSEEKSCKVWLHTIHFLEGLAAQKMTLQKLLGFAKLVDARFVEPCIRNGEMITCQNVDKILRFGDVFDLNSLKRVYANIVPYKEFKEVKEYDKYCLGLEEGNYFCNKFERNVPLVTLDNVTNVIENHRRKGCSKDIVLVIPRMRKELLPEPSISYSPTEFYSKFYVINEKHYNFVKNRIFPALGIKDNSYSVIHWRGEKVTTKLTTCAKALVRAKNTMASQLPESHQFVLMTSFRRPDTSKFQWDFPGVTNERGKKLLKEQVNALDILDNNSFVSLDSKIQSFSQEIDDGSFLALWDLVIAQKAHSFVTCTRYGVDNSCPAAEICKACNHLGSFGRWAVFLREVQNKTSEQCWPT